ncbi:unnamed protein product [Pedinophyceae sp. YPF-701]|nr:unnamed protein product [Pedinophyceae sp. YPF-701]
MLGGIPQSMVPTIRGAYTRLRPTSPCRVRADVQVIVNNPKNQRAPPPGGLTTEQRRILQHFSAVDHQLGVGVPGDAFGPFQPPVVPFTSQAPGSFGTFQQPAHMQYAAGMASPAVGAQHGGWLQQMPAPVRDTNRGTGAVRFAVLETIIDEGAGTR